MAALALILADSWRCFGHSFGGGQGRALVLEPHYGSSTGCDNADTNNGWLYKCGTDNPKNGGT